jgi:hypothetical protein
MLAPLFLLQAAIPRPEMTLTGTFRSRRLTESSGVVVSRAHIGILWTHNDSGDGPYLYATDLHGSDRGAVRVTGAKNLDWEALSHGPCPDAPVECIYIGDTGDNLQDHRSVTIYAVAEPQPPTGPADTLRATPPARALRFRYPDGPHDVEALFVSPHDSAMYLVSKGRNSAVRLYRLPRSAWSAGTTARAEVLQRLPIIPDASSGRLVTDAAIRRDGALVVVRTYTEIYFFVPRPGGRLSPIGPSCPITGLERIGEAIDFLDDSTFVLTSEADFFGRGTIHTVRCAH